MGIPGEYVCELIGREQRLRTAREGLDELLLAALDPGPSIPVTPESWAEQERRLLGRASQV